MGNGLPVVVPLAVVVVVPLAVVVAARLAPRSSPNHSCLPSVLCGPCQIFVITAASWAVITPHGVTSPMSLPGFQSQIVDGSCSFLGPVHPIVYYFLTIVNGL
jgi:hypothetical protein